MSQPNPDNRLRLTVCWVYNAKLERNVIWNDYQFLRGLLIDPYASDNRTPEELAARYKKPPTSQS